VILGGVFGNYLLRIASFVLIFGEVVTVGYDIASVFYAPAERGFILGAEAFTYGGILIVYGIALRRLQKGVGSVAGYAGLFEIIAGSLFPHDRACVHRVLRLMPAELLEIIILYKGSTSYGRGRGPTVASLPRPPIKALHVPWSDRLRKLHASK